MSHRFRFRGSKPIPDRRLTSRYISVKRLSFDICAYILRHILALLSNRELILECWVRHEIGSKAGNLWRCHRCTRIYLFLVTTLLRWTWDCGTCSTHGSVISCLKLGHLPAVAAQNTTNHNDRNLEGEQCRVCINITLLRLLKRGRNGVSS